MWRFVFTAHTAYKFDAAWYASGKVDLSKSILFYLQKKPIPWTSMSLKDWSVSTLLLLEFIKLKKVTSFSIIKEHVLNIIKWEKVRKFASVFPLRLRNAFLSKRHTFTFISRKCSSQRLKTLTNSIEKPKRLGAVRSYILKRDELWGFLRYILKIFKSYFQELHVKTE